MLSYLLVLDRSAGKPDQAEHRCRVQVSGETITARALLRTRVYQEVERYNRQQPEIFRLLVQPEGAEPAGLGFRLPHPRLIDPELQFEKAVEAFERGDLLVLVDDRQLASIDAQIPLLPATMVTFYKLAPLMGG